MKLNKGGNSLPLGSLLFGSRNSSKKGCAHASKGVIRALGVYSSSLLARAMASGGVLGLNTFLKFISKFNYFNAYLRILYSMDELLLTEI